MNDIKELLISRDFCFNTQKVDINHRSTAKTVSDYIDYQHLQYFQNQESSDEANKIKRAGLMKLFKLVYEQELTDKQKEVVYLVKVRGLKQKEAAEFIGIDKTTVSRHLKYAQKKFDDALKFYECKR